MFHYTKPTKLKYTDMAIYIDNRFKEYPEKPLTVEEEEQVYKYLYWLSYMLSCKKRLFNKRDDYEDFCKVVAGRYFIRLLNPKQWEDPPRLTPIKSILNYMKNTIYQMGVDFKQDNFCQIIDPNNMRDINVDGLCENVYKDIQSQYSGALGEWVEEDIKKIPSIIKEEVEKLHISDKVIKHNIYLSCILSFVNITTLSNKDTKLIQRRFERNQLDENLVLTCYTKSASDSIILWHLDDSYNNQVELLVNKTKMRIASLLQANLKDTEISEEVMKDIMWSSFSDTVGGNMEDTLED